MNPEQLFMSTERRSKKILEIVAKTGNSQLTATSYVDNILQHHLATFRNAINQLHQEQNYHNIV